MAANVCQRVIPEGAEARAFDVEQLKVKLCIDGKSPSGGCGGDMSLLPVHVEVIEAGLPSQLTDKIEAKVEGKVEERLGKEGTSGRLAAQKDAQGVEKNYLVLIKLEPSLIGRCIDAMMTDLRCDDSQSSSPKRCPLETTTKRMIVQMRKRRRDDEYYRKLMEKREKAAEDAEKKRIEGERKRAMIESGRYRCLDRSSYRRRSKRSFAMRRKAEKRMAKTGCARPYEGEGAKERRKGKAKNV